MSVRSTLHAVPRVDLVFLWKEKCMDETRLDPWLSIQKYEEKIYKYIIDGRGIRTLAPKDQIDKFLSKVLPDSGALDRSAIPP